VVTGISRRRLDVGVGVGVPIVVADARGEGAGVVVAEDAAEPERAQAGPS
jgi:hypothetical protein